jgi:hypothetical protein
MGRRPRVFLRRDVKIVENSGKRCGEHSRCRIHESNRLNRIILVFVPRLLSVSFYREVLCS